MLEELELTKLFDIESDWGKEHIMDPLTDEIIKRTEGTIGYKLPQSYLELLRFQNGGAIEDDDCWLTVIYGIGATEDTYNGLEEMFDNWINEGEYPNIGIPFGETQTAGHDMYFMDYRNLDAVGEPIIVHVENEGDLEDIKISKVADNFKEFLEMVLSGKFSE